MDIDEGPLVGGLYGPYYQTQRKALYQQYAHQLIASGNAYRCYCTPARLEQMRNEQMANKLPPRYDRRCRYLSDEERAANDAAGLTSTVRFAMPLDGETVVHDELHGTSPSRMPTLTIKSYSNQMVCLRTISPTSSMTI